MNVNPEMAALYDEKCEQLKGIIDGKLRGSCIRARTLYVSKIDTSLKYIFNIEKQKATSKQITHLKLVDNLVTEDVTEVIRQITIDYYRTLFIEEPVVYDNIDNIANIIFTNIIMMADKHNIPKSKMHSSCRLLPDHTVCKHL